MGRIRSHLSYANVAATLALVFAMSGGAIAATGGFSSGGTLRACANEEGRLKLLKSGEHCKRGQKNVSWNQTGPAGAPGAKGVAGAAGVPGAAGAAGAAGAKGTTGEAANVSWARVSITGALENGHGVVSSELVLQGFYVVTFDHDVTHCAFTATGQGLVPELAAPLVKPAAAEGPTKAVVETYNTDEKKSQNIPFSVVAYC
jgi:hypothetical protein